MDGAPIGHLWPTVLREGDVQLRPLRRRDRRAWVALRERNRAWLRRWDATSPDGAGIYASFTEVVRQQNRLAREGRAIPLGIDYEGRLVGQIGLSCIMWGSLRSGSIGYWVDEAVAGRGIVPTAVAMLTDHALLTAGLHRIEINIRPENVASLRVVEKLWFRDEGVRYNYLHIDGEWRDHRGFAVTTADVLPAGMLARWRASRPASVVGPDG